MASKPREPVSRQRKQKAAKRPAPLRQYFALLHSASMPSKALNLECNSATDQTISIRFTPSYSIPELSAQLGMIALDASLPELTLSSLTDVKHVCRDGGNCTLTVIADAPAELEKWPAPKRNGLFKAFHRALAQLQTEPIQLHRLWLAQQFAIHGYTTAKLLAGVMERCSEKSKPWPASVAKTENLWIWREAVAQWVGRLAHEVKRRQQRNHFLDELHAWHVRNWLGLEHPELIELALKAFAPSESKRIQSYPDGLVVALSSTSLPSPPMPAEAELVRVILKRYPAGEGLSVLALGKAYPSHKHVIAALVEARQLVEGPDEWVFTRSQLRSYFKALQARGSLRSVPSVRLLKDVLELERRPAEALRAYLETTMHADTQAPHRARRQG